MSSCCYLGSLEYSHLRVCSKESNKRRENCQGRCPVTSVYLVKTYCATVRGRGEQEIQLCSHAASRQGNPLWRLWIRFQVQWELRQDILEDPFKS